MSKCSKLEALRGATATLEQSSRYPHSDSPYFNLRDSKISIALPVSCLLSTHPPDPQMSISHFSLAGTIAGVPSFGRCSVDVHALPKLLVIYFVLRWTRHGFQRVSGRGTGENRDDRDYQALTIRIHEVDAKECGATTREDSEGRREDVGKGLRATSLRFSFFTSRRRVLEVT